MSKRSKLIDIISEASSLEATGKDFDKSSYLAAFLDEMTKDTVSYRNDAEQIITICCPGYWQDKEDNYFQEMEDI